MSSIVSNPALACKMRAKVAQAIAEDARCRVPGVTEGLYGLADLEPFSQLTPECNVPAILPTNVEFDRAADDAEFRRRLVAASSVFETFPFKKYGLCLAGGAASALALSNAAADSRKFHDFDLFIYDKSEDEALLTLEAVAKHVATWARDKYDISMTVFRTQGCITFHCKQGLGDYCELILQVVLRRYSTVAEIIHGFDLGSSAFLWDGERLFTTAMGKLAAEHGVNVLNLQARRASYESRLERYFTRGFGLVLPRLDAGAVIALRGRLPFLHVGIDWHHHDSDVYAADKHGHIVTAYGISARRPSNWKPVPDTTPDALAPAAESEVSFYAANSIPYHSEYAINRRNLWALGKDQTPHSASLCAMHTWCDGLDITKIEPMVSSKTILDGLSSALFPGDVNLRRLVRLVGRDRAASIMLDTLREPDLRVPHSTLEATARQVADELNRKASIPFAFMTVEDKTALTGPFNRCLVTADEWYGDALFGALYTRTV